MFTFDHMATPYQRRVTSCCRVEVLFFILNVPYTGKLDYIAMTSLFMFPFLLIIPTAFCHFCHLGIWLIALLNFPQNLVYNNSQTLSYRNNVAIGMSYGVSWGSAIVWSYRWNRFYWRKIRKTRNCLSISKSDQNEITFYNKTCFIYVYLLCLSFWR